MRTIRLIVFVLTLACVMFAVYRAYQQDWDDVVAQSGWIIGGLALIVWMYVGNRWLMPSSVRKQLASSKALQNDFVVSWDAERIVLETSHGLSRYPWGDLYRWQESPGSFLLWQGMRSYFCLPKRALSETQISEIRANLTRAVGGQGKRRK